MFYLSSDVKTPRFIILWFFFIFFIIYIIFTKQLFSISLSVLIILQFLLLYLMYYLYSKYAQNIIQLSALPVHIELKKINLSNSFNEPDFRCLLHRDNLLMFDVYLHNDYYKDDYKYKKELNEEIRYHINTIWKNVILYLKRYNAYLTRVLVYCFIFGLLILLLCVIAYAQFDWSLYTDVHKKFYKFFTFLSLSFWMYVSRIILFSEAVIEKIDNNKSQYNIFSIYNNSGIKIQEQNKLGKEIEEIDKYIQNYIGISTTVLYISFLTILGIMF